MFFLFAQTVMNFLAQPWPWYVSGAAIAGVMLLLLFSGKHFGVSASMRATCSALGGGQNCEFFNFDWKKSQGWNMLFVLGAVIGGFIATYFMSSPEPIELGARTMEHVQSIGFSAPATSETTSGLLPAEFADTNFIFSVKGLLMFIIGGFLVGFGARYAGGCTSGHAISGLSDLQLPSLIAVIGFFIGGLTMTYLLMPLLLG
jgi:uncharacterized membrane protein YedE/YeeE